MTNNNHLRSLSFAAGLVLSLGIVINGQVTPRTEQTLSSGSTAAAAVELGTTVLNDAARLLDEDPYAEFRNASYSNEGVMIESEEVKLGDELHKELSKKFTLLSSGQDRATRIGLRVAQRSRRPDVSYKFYVVKDKSINAFAIPGGHVYITNALLALANDDELASVIAHEIGHVVARHSLKSLRQAQAVGGLADIVGSITGIAGEDAGNLGKLASWLVASPLLLAHSREQEREADFLGINNMFAAGYNADGMVTMFQKLQKVGARDSSLLGTLFSDHPDVDERIENSRYEIKRLRR